MRSSNRQPRYRHRFLTQARNQRRVLQDMADQQQLPLGDEAAYFWRLLFRGLCLKSASEVGVSPEGIPRAARRARRVFQRDDSAMSMSWDSLVSEAERRQS